LLLLFLPSSAVGWHLQSLQERAALDAQQWKQHCEELEAAGKQREAEWEGAKAGLEQQVQGLKVRRGRYRRVSGCKVGYSRRVEMGWPAGCR
jgi:hypothetical protein